MRLLRDSCRQAAHLLVTTLEYCQTRATPKGLMCASEKGRQTTPQVRNCVFAFCSTSAVTAICFAACSPSKQATGLQPFQKSMVVRSYPTVQKTSVLCKALRAHAVLSKLSQIALAAWPILYVASSEARLLEPALRQPCMCRGGYHSIICVSIRMCPPYCFTCGWRKLTMPLHASQQMSKPCGLVQTASAACPLID